MIRQTRVIRSTVAAIGLFLSAGTMAAPAFGEDASDSSIEQCVAQIADQANYNDASRVQHHVAPLKHRTVGQLLKIDTRVYGDEDGQVIREYAATCVIGRDGTPLMIRIRQIDTEV
jgi:hypothetical protein